MDQLREFIFGDPTVGVIGLAILAVLLGVLAWRGRGAIRLAPLAPAALAGVLLIADALVTTDREKVEQVLVRAADRVQNAKWQELGDLMTEDFEWRLAGAPCMAGRDQTLQYAGVLAYRHTLGSVKTSELQVAVGDGTATATLRIKFSGGNKGADSHWRLTLIRQSNGDWLMSSADMLDLDGRPVKSLP
jgi:ketosteroid isomerase-like protein